MINILTITRRQTTVWHYHVYDGGILEMRLVKMNEGDEIRVTEMKTPFLKLNDLTLLIESILLVLGKMDLEGLEVFTMTKTS